MSSDTATGVDEVSQLSSATIYGVMDVEFVIDAFLGSCFGSSWFRNSATESYLIDGVLPPMFSSSSEEATVTVIGCSLFG